MLNFSSEIEFDERFDYDKFQLDNFKGSLVDKSVPSDIRPSKMD